MGIKKKRKKVRVMRGHASNGKGGLEHPKSQKELPSLEPRGLPEQQERAAPKSLLIHKR